jgi:hypothetical protein
MQKTHEERGVEIHRARSVEQHYEPQRLWQSSDPPLSRLQACYDFEESSCRLGVGHAR